MGTVAVLRPNEKQDFTSALGMMIFLGSWAMMFSALFFAYLFLRAKATVWPPPGVPMLPVALPAVNTVLLLASSATFAQGLKALGRGKNGTFSALVGVTLALGTLFLGLQFVVWTGVAASGLHVSTNMYGSVFYGLTMFHALHVAVGLLVLAWVLVRSLQRKYTEHNTINVRLCTMFWHFVDAVWLLMFLTIYVL